MSKEAIEAAWKKYRDGALAVRVSKTDFLGGFEAALPFLPIAVEEKVKALEWEDATDRGYSQANCALGQYQVTWLGEFECWQCGRPHRAGIDWKDNFSRHPTKDEAKAAAQSDYENRILSALISSPGKDGGPEVEAVDWFETCLNIVHEHKKVYVVERDDLKRRGKANAHFYASLVNVCDSISQAIHDARAAAPSPQPASAALVEAEHGDLPQSPWPASDWAIEQIDRLTKALEPFARVAEHDIGESEADSDFFMPMKTYNRAPLLTVGDFRNALALRAKAEETRA